MLARYSEKLAHCYNIYKCYDIYRTDIFPEMMNLQDVCEQLNNQINILTNIYEMGNCEDEELFKDITELSFGNNGLCDYMKKCSNFSYEQEFMNHDDLKGSIEFIDEYKHILYDGEEINWYHTLDDIEHDMKGRYGFLMKLLALIP